MRKPAIAAMRQWVPRLACVSHWSRKRPPPRRALASRPMRTRRSFRFACFLVVGVSLGACAQAVNDDPGADQGTDLPDSGVADTSDGSHHNYNNDSAVGGDTG